MTSDEFDQICAIRAGLFRDIENVHTLTRRDALALADSTIAAVIGRLRQRDPRRSFESWWMELAPTHERLVEMIAAVIDGRASLKEILGIIEAMP